MTIRVLDGVDREPPPRGPHLAAEGRHLYGELVLTDPEGARVGRGVVVIGQIAP